MKVRICAVHSRVGRALENPPLETILCKGGCPLSRRGAHLGNRITNIQMGLFRKRSRDSRPL